MIKGFHGSNNKLSPAEEVLEEMYGINMDFNGENAALAAAVTQVIIDRATPFTEIKPQENLEDCREAMVWGMNCQTQLIRRFLQAMDTELKKNNND